MPLVSKAQIVNIATIAIAVVIGNIGYSWLKKRGYLS